MRRFRKIIKIVLIFLISVIGFVILIFFFINLPFSQRFVTEQTNQVLSKSKIPIHIQSIRTLLPTKVHLQGVRIINDPGDTLIYVGELQVDYSLPALLKQKVKLGEINLSSPRVTLSRNFTTSRYDIAEAFSPDQKPGEVEPEKRKSSWEISIRRGELSNINFQMIDTLTGINIVQEISALKIRKFNLSLLNKALRLNSVEINGAEGVVKIGPRLLDQKGEDGSPWNFGLQKISLNNLNFTYDHGSDSLLLNLILEEGLIRANQMDLNKKEIDIDKISLKQAKATILTGNASPDPNISQIHSSVSFPWDIITEALDLENVTVMPGNYGDPNPYSTASEISILNLDMSLSDISLNNINAAVDVKKLSFDMGNGFSIKRTKGELDSHSGTTRLDLEIVTGNSQVDLEGDAEARFFDIIAKPSETHKAKIAFGNTLFSLRDMSYFKTDFQENPFFTSLANAPLILAGDIGLVDSILSFSEISVSQDRSFSITLEGIVENPFQSVRSRTDLQLGISDIDFDWLSEMLTAFGIEENVPEFTHLSVESNISDSFRSPDFTLMLISDLGNVDLFGSLDFECDSFSVNAEFDRLKLGKILGMDELGVFHGSGEFIGTGFNQETVVATVELLVDSLGFHDYDYTTTRLEGNVRPGVYDFNLLMDDPSLKWELNATVNSADSALEVKATATMLAQLNKLHLFEDTLAVESRITANFIKEREVIETDLTIADLKFTSPQDSAQVRQINASFRIDSVRTSLTGDADFFNATVRIDKPIGELGTVIQSYRNYISSFIDTLHINAATRVSHLPEMSATANITYRDALGLFIQDTTLRFTSLDFSLINRTSDHRIKYHMKGTGLKYKMVKMGEMNASITDSAGIMDLQVVADNNSIYSNPANKLLLTNRVAERKSLTELAILNKNNEIIYGFEIASEIDSNHIVLKVPSKELILNQVHWNLDTTTLLSVNLTNKTVSPDLRMHTDSAVLHIGSESDEDARLYRVALSNVPFSSILIKNVISGNPAGMISGLLNYRVDGDNNKSLSTDLHLKDVAWSDLNYNKIKIFGSYKSEAPGDYAVDMTALLDSSGFFMKGGGQEGGIGTLAVEFTDIPIHTFQPFVMDHVTALRGQISGNLNISSGKEIETMKGNLNISNANLRINTLNSSYKIPYELLRFEDHKVVFDKFRVLDSLDNELLIDGYIDFSDRSSVTTDLEVFSSKLQVMNRPMEESASFYGDIFIDSRLSLTGPLINPVVKGKILLSEGTEVFYQQNEDLTLSESEKIVNFVSHTTGDDQIIEPPIERQSAFMNSSVETIVEIDPTTRLNFNLSKRIYTIDLMIKGGGLLNYHMLTNDQISLSGKYEIDEGAADVKLIGWPNKSFRIEKGGFIRWDGMVENPELKLEALNRVSSSYVNPMDGKLRDVDFNVILQLNNQLSELDVVFTINTTDQYLMSIINTMSPEEKMRQAITILLFENIDLPGISTSTSYMTEQVNQLVASQLNQLTKTTIKGIDISFGIDSYVQSTETGGEETKTSLSYEVRKELLNNRAQIELSGRLNDLNQNPGASDMSLNNISFEYRLDSAATKYLKVYNEHSYEDVFVGEVTKTGVGITYRKRYRSFMDIWKRDERNEKTRSREK